jgi:hypothetical protein
MSISYKFDRFVSHNIGEIIAVVNAQVARDGNKDTRCVGSWVNPAIFSGEGLSKVIIKHGTTRTL